MRRKSEASPLIVACIAVFALFSVIAFLVLPDDSISFLVGYGVVLIAWLFLLVSVIATSISAKSGEHTMVTSIPIITYTAIHFIVQLVMAVLFMVIEKADSTAAIVLFLIVFLIYILALLLTVLYKRRSMNMLTESSSQTNFVESIRKLLFVMIKRCSSIAVKRKLVDISEELKYCDPVSSCETVDCEERIEQLVQGINDELDVAESDNLLKCDEILCLLAQRNLECLSGKRH